MTELKKGDPAPDFRLQGSDGTWTSLADFAGGKVILYFYPAALTPGCTIEAVDFSAAAPAFKEAGYTIVGVSPDTADKLTDFIKHSHLSSIFLLSDQEKTTLEAYGAWGERNLWGKIFTGVIRSTFVIEVDPAGQGTILDAEYGVRATGHVKRLRAELGV